MAHSSMILISLVLMAQCALILNMSGEVVGSLIIHESEDRFEMLSGGRWIARGNLSALPQVLRILNVRDVPRDCRKLSLRQSGDP